MKNITANEVCCMPTTTTSAIALSTSKTFLSHHFFNKDREDPVELLKGEKLD